MLTAARWSCHAHEVSNHVIERVSEASDVHGSTGSTCETKRKREKKTRKIEAGQKHPGRQRAHSAAQQSANVAYL
jgi:hypothetical protein